VSKKNAQLMIVFKEIKATAGDQVKITFRLYFDGGN
jgi:hypothetical protein